jgi:hypothetical protein
VSAAVRTFASTPAAASAGPAAAGNSANAKPATSDVYTHVLLDDRELYYRRLLALSA